MMNFETKATQPTLKVGEDLRGVKKGTWGIPLVVLLVCAVIFVAYAIEVQPVEVQLTTVADVQGLPTEGSNLWVIARVGPEQTLHFRIFDRDGAQVATYTDEIQAAQNAVMPGLLEALKRELDGEQWDSPARADLVEQIIAFRLRRQTALAIGRAERRGALAVAAVAVVLAGISLYEFFYTEFSRHALEAASVLVALSVVLVRQTRPEPPSRHAKNIVVSGPRRSSSGHTWIIETEVGHLVATASLEAEGSTRILEWSGKHLSLMKWSKYAELALPEATPPKQRWNPPAGLVNPPPPC